MSDKRNVQLAEAFGENLKSSYIQGYSDGFEGRDFDPGSIMMRGREHLFGYAQMQGHHDGKEDAADCGKRIS